MADGAFVEAVDTVMATLDGAVDVPERGEPTHGVTDFLWLRNRLFRRLGTPTLDSSSEGAGIRG